jgi:Flp pilus assembly protein TadG
MRLRRICPDEQGTSAIEFAITAPVFFMMLFGLIETGLLLWTQLGLQHGSERAARCATINTTTCSSVSAIQTYAAQQSFALNPSPSIFSVTTPACGNQVNADYSYKFLTTYFNLPTLTIRAQACFPK